MSPVRSDLEDFAPIVDATRRGAHRARPSALAGLLPVAAVVVVVGIVAAVVIAVLGGGDGTTSADDPPAASQAVSPTVQASQTPATTPTEVVTTEPAVTDPAASDPPSTTAGAAEGEVYLKVKITVLNDTQKAGLAKKGATKLTDAGWSSPTTGNHTPKGSLTTSVVYYSKPKYAATATKIAEDMGIGTVTESLEESGDTPVTVVLASDFQP